MRETPAAITRSSLLRNLRRLRQVHRAGALLKRKRQALVEELFARARTALTSREAVETQSRRAWGLLWNALAAAGSEGLTPLGWPVREVDVELKTVDLWGVRAAELVNRPAVARGLAARGMLPGSGEAVEHEAARELERLIELLLGMAPQEHAMRQLGRALTQTTRLVNTVEQRVTVTLVADIARIRRTLSEREREEHLRIKRLTARRRTARAPSVEPRAG